MSNVDCERSITERPLAYAKRLPQASAPDTVVAGPEEERCAQIIRGESDGMFQKTTKTKQKKNRFGKKKRKTCHPELQQKKKRFY